MLARPSACLNVHIYDERGFATTTYRRFTPIPERFGAEADRRWRSAPAAGVQCLNRCFLPFYAWVRERHAELVEDVAPMLLAMGLPVPVDLIPAHPHGPTAPHWFEPQLQ